MADYSFVPVDYQPDFEGVSLVPVDHDPFADDTSQQSQVQLAPIQSQLAQTQLQGSHLEPATGGSQPYDSEPADQSKAPLTDHTSHTGPGDNYPTADAAAIAALQNINRISQLRGQEYAGRIYHKWFGFGDYSFAPPREGEAFSSDPGNSLLTPLLHSLGVNAGTYHTHIRGTDPARDEEYSSGDTEKSDNEGLPSFLATPSGAIYKYEPVPSQPFHGIVSVIGRTSAPALPTNSPGVSKSKSP